MKKQYTLYYRYKGTRREFHAEAETYGEALASLFEFIDFLRAMGLTVETDRQDKERKY